MRQTPDDASRVYLWYDLEWFGRGLPRQHHNLQMSFPITRDRFHILSAGSKNVPECDPPLRSSPLAIHDLTKSIYEYIARICSSCTILTT
ncbi:hypothetical protein DTO212C5_9079 [Paecilomyces variotii]|nr:hypothetical protein DTO212C5_9079 [Paecilomyces variotii]